MNLIFKHTNSELLKYIGALADESGYRVFAVGGFVRDLLLGIDDKDIDIVIEADAINFAKKLAEKFDVGARRAVPLHLVTHAGFKTASIFFKKPIYGGTIKIDVATARKELYKKPAALPSVKPAAIKEDLARRDFTINAMAVSLNKGTFGELIDFFKGKQDLKKKNIRVLHDLSFVDDPTRIFRAVKFTKRLGFKIEPHTLGLLKRAVKEDMLGKLKKQRTEKEINLILSEAKADKIISEMFELYKDSRGIV